MDFSLIWWGYLRFHTVMYEERDGQVFDSWQWGMEALPAAKTNIGTHRGKQEKQESKNNTDILTTY